MVRFHSLALLLLLPCLLRAEKPNIVYILCDDLGYGDVACYNPDGKIKTPRMDALAKEGIRFTDAHTPSSVCSPTRYGVLTGRYAWRTRLKSGVLGGYSPPLIAEGRMTVASLLKQQGYATACVGKWHLGWEWPVTDGKKFGDGIQGATDKKSDPKDASLWNVDWTKPIARGPRSVGFDYHFGISASLDMPPYVYVENDRVVTVPTVTKKWIRSGPASADFEAVDVMPKLVEKSTAWIAEQAKAGKPFFLYLPLNSPHTPTVPSKEWQGKSGVSDYGDFVMQTDHAIGQVIDALKAAGVEKDTLLIVTSDNGASPAANLPELAAKGHHPNAPWRGTKADCFEGGHRVPFIVRWPAQVKPAVCSHVICLTDLLATAAEVTAAKVSADAGEDSVSFLPLLREPSRMEPTRTETVHHSINGKFALRQGDWKLVLAPGSGGWSEPRDPQAAAQGLPPRQLFNMRSDPDEKQNLQSAEPERLAAMVKALKQIVDGKPNDKPVDIEPPVAKAKK